MLRINPKSQKDERMEKDEKYETKSRSSPKDILGHGHQLLEMDLESNSPGDRVCKCFNLFHYRCDEDGVE